jgi:hypothetical protein
VPAAAIVPTQHQTIMPEHQVEVLQYVLAVAAFTVSVLLGKQLQTGYAEWQERKR